MPQHPHDRVRIEHHAQDPAPSTAGTREYILHEHTLDQLRPDHARDPQFGLRVRHESCTQVRTKAGIIANALVGSAFDRRLQSFREGHLIQGVIWTNHRGKFMNVPNWLMPALLSFGSIFIVIGPSRASSLSYVALVGALMLSVGLCALFIKVQNLEKEIKVLKAKKKE